MDRDDGLDTVARPPLRIRRPRREPGRRLEDHDRRRMLQFIRTAEGPGLLHFPEYRLLPEALCE